MNVDYGFRAKFYDLEFADNSDKQLLTTLISETTSTILEIPCGSGRNIWLAETGKLVCFADLSSKMVDQVQQKLDDKSLNNAKTVVADMTKMGIGRFDLIIVAREGIQLLSKKQVRLAFKALRESLAEGGRLYVDFAKLDGRSSDLSNLPEYIKTRGEVFTLDVSYDYNGTKLQRFHRSQLRGDSLYVEFKYRLEGTEAQSYMAELVLADYKLEEICRIASECDLVLYDIFGGYTGTPYTDESERFIVIFKKR